MAHSTLINECLIGPDICNSANVEADMSASRTRLFSPQRSVSHSFNIQFHLSLPRYLLHPSTTTLELLFHSHRPLEPWQTPVTLVLCA